MARSHKDLATPEIHVASFGMHHRLCLILCNNEREKSWGAMVELVTSLGRKPQPPENLPNRGTALIRTRVIRSGHVFLRLIYIYGSRWRFRLANFGRLAFCSVGRLVPLGCNFLVAIEFSRCPLGLFQLGPISAAGFRAVSSESLGQLISKHPQG